MAVCVVRNSLNDWASHFPIDQTLITSLICESCNKVNVYAYGSFPEEVNRAVNLIYANIRPERLKALHLESHQVLTESPYSCLSYDLV